MSFFGGTKRKTKVHARKYFIRVMFLWPQEQPTLVSGDITIRPPTSSDTHSVFESCQDADIQEYTTVPTPYKYEDAEYFVNSIVADGFKSNSLLALCIDYKGTFAGIVSLQGFDGRDHLAKVGYWVSKGMRGKGVALQATLMICDYGFKTMGLRRIEGLVLPGNLGSGRVLTKCGFEREALLKSRVTRQSGEQSDAYLYAKTNNSTL